MSQLALAGGVPVRTKPFPRWPQFDEREREAVIKVLESGNWGGYPFPNHFAKLLGERFAACHDARFGVSVANGTVALEAALQALGVGPRDEVIIPAYTFEASAVPVLRLQAIPVFVDVLEDTYCIDPQAVEESITPRTKAVIPVHLAMNMADMDALTNLAKKYDLKILEDAAHAHGAKWRNRGAGSLGDAGAFSMQTTKLMTAGEGGVITTKDEEVFELCASYVNCGRASAEDRFGHRILGYNHRITEFQAAILLVQLERLVEQTRLRQANAKLLGHHLAQIPGLSLLKKDDRVTDQAIYQYVFKYDAEAFGELPRERFLAALEAEGIPCDGTFYEPVYKSALFPVRRNDSLALAALPGCDLPWQDLECPVSERAAYKESVWLHHSVLLGNDSDIEQIIEAIQKIHRNVDEIRHIDHKLITIKSVNRAERDKLVYGIA